MTELHLAVGLDGYGWHPQAWRYAFVHNATGGGQLSGRYWAALAGTAERGMLDFLTIDDSLDAQPGRREPKSARGASPDAPMPRWWPPGSRRPPDTSA